MNEMFELEGVSLTVHLPGDVDHPVSDEIRRESDRIMSHVSVSYTHLTLPTIA